MLTPEQEEWIESLSDRTISIVPYDPRTEELFTKVKERIFSVLGTDVEIEHCGASSFGISGQNEIDVSVVVEKEKFEDYIPKLEKIFGPVRTIYSSRARFEVREDGKKIDLKLVDAKHSNYLEGKRFENYLRSHPKDLERYRIIKEECDGMTIKEYYRRKTEFINEIVRKADDEEHTEE